MPVVDEYIATLNGDTRSVIAHMYAVVRTVVPDVTQGLSYGMPALKYKGKGLFSALQTKQGMSLYPYCSLDSLGLAEVLKDYDQTKGSLHFSLQQPVPDDLICAIVTARVQQIADAAA